MATATPRTRFIAVGAAGLMVALTSAVGLGAGASADPTQLQAGNFVGTGSDTTQEVLNAFAGFSAGNYYTPLHTTSFNQILSFDATKPPAGDINTCIETGTARPNMYRPNGSTEGRRALSRAFGGGNYGISDCGGAKSVSGLVDFARSSAYTASSTVNLVYIPFARDGLSFAYDAVASPVTNLTSGQLTGLFSTGPASISGKLLVPCGIQIGSGTYQFWNTANGINATQEETGTVFCNNIATTNPSSRVQESKADQLNSKLQALIGLTDPLCDGVAGGAAVSCADAQVIVGFSASAYAAAANGTAPAQTTIPNVVKLGSINGVSPFATTNPYAANPTFFNSGTYGREVYNVLPNETILDIQGGGSGAIAEMFYGSSSKICTDGAQTITDFGFLTLPSTTNVNADGFCGSIAKKGDFISGSK